MLIKLVYPISSCYVLEIERDELPENPEDLLSSITRDELLNGVSTGPGYDDLKDVMRQAELTDVEVLDKDDQQLYVNTGSEGQY